MSGRLTDDVASSMLLVDVLKPGTAIAPGNTTAGRELQTPAEQLGVVRRADVSDGAAVVEVDLRVDAGARRCLRIARYTGDGSCKRDVCLTE